MHRSLFRLQTLFTRKHSSSSSVRLSIDRLEDRTLLNGAGLGELLVPPSSETVLVKFEDGVIPVSVDGTTILNEVGSGTGVYQVALDPSFSSVDAIAAYNALPGVVYAESNSEFQLTVIPNDTYFDPYQWDLNNYGQNGGTPDADIDAPEAWDYLANLTPTQTIIVAVIDTGADYNHSDLNGVIWSNTGEIAGNGIDDDGNGFVDDFRGWDFSNNDNNPYDGHGHGTHVSGTIAAEWNNNTGIAGIASTNVQIMPLKVLSDSGSGYTSDIVSSIYYAVDNGAKVINASLGGGGYSQAMYNALNYARSNGVLFVAAAGNNASDNDLSPFYPATYNLDNVISVASTDRNDNLSSFSNYGDQTVHLAAPGSSIASTVPGGYSIYSGTSMAAPHVAGAAALLWAYSPTSTTYGTIRTTLFSTADSLSSLSNRVITGARLNLFNAVSTLDNGGGGGGGENGDTTPPTVVSSSPTGTLSGSVSQATFTFSEDVTFSTSNITSFTFTPMGSSSSYDLLGQITGVTGSGSSYTVSFANQSAGGTYSMVVSGVQDLAGNTMTGSYTNTFDIQNTFTYTNSTRYGIYNGYYTISQITINDAVNIADMNVEIDITHYNDYQLEIYLRTPNGTFIPLSLYNGGRGNHYDNTIFDDEASTYIYQGSAPFRGSYKPEYANLNTVDGTSAIGTWELWVGDAYGRAGRRDGFLNLFKITIEGSNTSGGASFGDSGDNLVTPPPTIDLRPDGVDETLSSNATVFTNDFVTASQSRPVATTMSNERLGLTGVSPVQVSQSSGQTPLGSMYATSFTTGQIVSENPADESTLVSDNSESSEADVTSYEFLEQEWNDGVETREFSDDVIEEVEIPVESLDSLFATDSQGTDEDDLTEHASDLAGKLPALAVGTFIAYGLSFEGKAKTQSEKKKQFFSR